MQEQYTDRCLRCADCNTDFIFTAGEQLFFSEKQFKNDPKRCKSCKSRRSGLAAVASGQSLPKAGLLRTETRTECSECGVETTVPFKPTQGRPVLCRQCFGLKGSLRPAGRTAAVGVAAQAAVLAEVSIEPSGKRLSPDAALLAATSMASASAASSVATEADLLFAAQTVAKADGALGDDDAAGQAAFPAMAGLALSSDAIERRMASAAHA